MYKNSSIAVILPAFNEAATIEASILEFHQHLPEAKIYIIDNCSNDGTGIIARKALEKFAVEGFVINERRKGKGNALRTAFLTIDADIYLMSDADMTYPANLARDLISPILNREADMVVGDRHFDGQYGRENKRLFHEFGNSLVRFLINLFFRAKLSDVMSGYRAFSKDFVKTYPILVSGFQVETEMTLHALDKRFRIQEIPVGYKNRKEGSVSKLNTYKDGLKVLIVIIKILRYYRPLLFFTALASFFSILGLIASIPVFTDWIEYRYIYHIPLAIFATGMEIFALMLFGIGLILDSLGYYHRMEFECLRLEKSNVNVKG